MIRPLRLWHRRWFLLLAIALPIVLFLALRDRPKVPWVVNLPVVAGASPAAPAAVPTQGEAP